MEEVTKIQKSLKRELTQATDYVCKNKADFEVGGNLLKTFKDAEKQAKALKDKALKPSLETTAQIREYFRPLETNLKNCITSVKDGMDAWNRAEQERADKAKAKVLGDARISKQDTLERKLEEISASTANGHTRKVRRIKVVDLTKIPLEYFDLNETRLKAALMEGIEVPGATLVNETIIVS
jgi:ribosome-binding ATPase YchF (GTP1/OBG family)